VLAPAFQIAGSSLGHPGAGYSAVVTKALHRVIAGQVG